MCICSFVCIILTALFMLGIFYKTDINGGNYIIKIIIPVSLVIIGVLLISTLLASILADHLTSPVRDIDLSAVLLVQYYQSDDVAFGGDCWL